MNFFYSYGSVFSWIDQIHVIPSHEKVCLNYKFKDVSTVLNQELDFILNLIKSEFDDEILTCKRLSSNKLEFSCLQNIKSIIKRINSICSKCNITTKQVDKITYISAEFDLASLLNYVVDRTIKIIQSRCGVNCSFEDNMFQIITDKSRIDEVRKLLESTDTFSICVIDISENQSGETCPVYGGGISHIREKIESNHFKKLFDNITTVDKSINIHLSKSGLNAISKYSNISKYRSLYLGFLINGQIFRPIPIKRDLIVSSDLQLGEVSTANEAKFLANSINYGNIAKMKFIIQTSYEHSRLEKILALFTYLMILIFGVYLFFKSRKRFLLFSIYIATSLFFCLKGYSLIALIIFIFTLPIVTLCFYSFTLLLTCAINLSVAGLSIRYLGILDYVRNYSRFIPKIGTSLTILGSILLLIIFVSAAFNFKWWENNEINSPTMEKIDTENESNE